jgi:tetratricopeptide (TPR) repeat protein
VALALAFLVCAAPRAAAQPKPEPGPAMSADRAEAARMFGAGEMAFKKGDYESAAQSFEAAYKVFPAPEIAFSAAQAYRLGNSLLPKPRPEYVKRAIELYEVYVAANKQGSRVRDAATHLQSLRDLWRSLEAIGAAQAAQMRYDRTQLTVWAAAEGAEVTIDGEPAAPYDYVDVQPGEHVVTVTAPGHFPFEQLVSVAEGAQVPVAAELRAKPAVVQIATEAGAEIAIDGRPVTLVDGKVEAAAGRRYLTITRAGREPFSKELELAPGGQAKIAAPLATTARRKASRWVMWGSLGMLGVTALTTTVALVADDKAVSQRDEVNQPSDQEYEKWRSRRDAFRAAAFTTGALAIAGGAIAAVLYFSDHPRAGAPPLFEDEAPAKRPQFTPMVWSEGAGVALQGGF